MIASGIADAGRLLRSGETTARALLEEALETASRTEAQLHAYLTIVVGTLTIFFVGLGIAFLLPGKKQA